MSPTEGDLRAALQAGEDDGPGVDADAIIAGVRTHLARRRVRLMSVTAAAAVVAGVAVAGSVLFAGGSGGHSQNSAQAGSAGARVYGKVANGTGGGNYAAGHGSPAATPTAGVRPTPANAQPAQGCPTAPPVFAHATLSPAAGQAAVPLFATSVQTVVVCAYGAGTDQTTRGATGRVELTGPEARAFTAPLSLARSAKGECVSAIDGPAQEFTVLGLDAHGSRAGVFVLRGNGGCTFAVSSSTGTFTWEPSSTVESVLDRLAALPSSAGTSLLQGSPIHT